MVLILIILMNATIYCRPQYLIFYSKIFSSLKHVCSVIHFIRNIFTLISHSLNSRNSLYSLEPFNNYLIHKVNIKSIYVSMISWFIDINEWLEKCLINWYLNRLLSFRNLVEIYRIIFIFKVTYISIKQLCS